MTCKEIFEFYQNVPKGSRAKTITDHFNSLEIPERKAYLSYLESLPDGDAQAKDFTDLLRAQAVKDFWTNEKELIESGQGTRDWTPEQIESILNISQKTGESSKNGAAAIVLDADGNPVLKKHGDNWINEVYEGHHMLNVDDYPEYAGEYRNIQALARGNSEHLEAHGGDYKNATDWYFNVETREPEKIEIVGDTNVFDKISNDVPPKVKSIFKSDTEMKALYDGYDNLTAGEQLALKNVDLSMSDSGSLKDFNRGLDVAKRYNSPDFDSKMGIMSDTDICQKYHYLGDMTDTDIDTFKAYEYFKKSGVDDVNIEKLGVKSDSTLLNKYKFMGSDAEALDTIRAYEYQCTKKGTTPDIKVYYDMDGKIAHIEVPGVTSNAPTDMTRISAVFDVSADGSTKAYLNAPNNGAGDVWWKSQTYNLITDQSVTHINGVPVEHYNSVYNNLDVANNPGLVNKVNDAIADIPANNVDEMALARNAAEGKTQFVDPVPGSGAKGTRMAALLDTFSVLGDVADVVDVTVTMCVAYEQYKAGDVEGASDTLGKWGMNTLGSTLFAYGGSVAFGALVSAGVISGPVGWLAIFTAGLVGGIFFEDLWDMFLDPLNDDYSNAGKAQPPRDPLAIDLGALGIQLTPLTDEVHFDLDKNGFAENTAWIGREDGFLVMDRNGDGVINDGGELFGDQVQLDNGLLSVSGFEALRELDENGDGVINADDRAWADLRVWIDASHDGRSDGELKTLDDLDITSISLTTTKEENVDTETGTMEAEYAMVTFRDGSQRKISEFWFPVDSSDTTQDTEDGEIVETTGNVPNIHVAIEADETGTLAGLYKQFLASEDFVEKRLLLKQILYFVTDATDIAPNARGGNIDARDLHVIESFMGREFVGVGGKNPNSNAANILKNLYTSIENLYFNMLNIETTDGLYINTVIEFENENGEKVYDLRPVEYILETMIAGGENVDSLVYSIASYLVYYDRIKSENAYEEFSKYCVTLSPDYAQIMEYAKSVNTYLGTAGYDYFNGTNASDFVFGNEGNDSLRGKNGNDILYGGEGKDSIYGDAGADTLYGNVDNDLLYGGAGNDMLYGEADNDTLDGGAGTDYLYGGEGDDVYVFAKGYGYDTIADSEGQHTIRFSNLNPEDILVNGTGEYDVTISIRGTSDKLIIENFRKGEEYSDYTLEFKGVKMHVTDKNSPFRHIYGSESDDVLKAVIDDSIINAFGGDDIVYGSDGNDIIYGNEGNDTVNAGKGNDYIYGGAGDDILDGREGNDFFYGDEGDDTYVFGRGYGTDIIHDNVGISKIKLAEDITLEDIEIHSVGENIVLSIKDSEDKLIVNGVAQNPDMYELFVGGESISIADNLTDSDSFTSGTTNSDYIVNEEHSIIAGGAGVDRIIGNESSEYIFGDSGNDQLLAGAGDDIISGGIGDDYMNGGAGNDIIDGGSGNDFIDGGLGNDTYFFNPGYGADSIMDSEGINTIMFGDGFKADGIKAYRSNWNDLLITFDGYEDTLTIKNYCINEAARVFTLVFADGTVVEATDRNSPLRTIYGTDGSEYMSSIYSDGVTKIGNDGNDQLVGDAGSDYLYGNAGDDRITASAGNDVLEGGAGNDYLYGEAGNDTYIYKKGYGVDKIGDSAGTNRIEIYGYSRNDVKAYRTNWNDITIAFKDSEDKLVIEGFFNSEANRNFYLSFNGGSEIHATASGSPLRTIYGTENGDYIIAMDDRGVTILGEAGSDGINGANGADKLYGGSGDDQLYGNGGNDILDAGTGNDISYGGDGKDTYIFNAGYGVDTVVDSQGINVIKFGAGLNKADMKAYRTNWNDLTLTFEGLEDKLVIQGYFTSEQNRNFSVEFADGQKYAYDDAQNPIKEVYANEYDDWMSAWSDEGIILHGAGGNDNLNGGAGNDVLYGDVGNDSLYGNDGNDTLNGGSGNDMLIGGNGDDTYVYAVGSGSDTIDDQNGVNKVVLDGVNVDDVSFNIMDNSDLLMTFKDSEDTLLIKSFETEKYTFDLSDGVSGNVDTNSGSFVEITEEEDVIQSNADLLADMYSQETLSTEYITQNDDTYIVAEVEATSVADETNELGAQTDVQAMILVENASAFGQEENVSDGISVTTTNEASVTEQLLINPQM